MNLKKLLILGTLFSAALSSTLSAKEELPVGIVNFRSCIEKSIIGQAEQNKMEIMRNEMAQTFENKEKELNDIAEKLKKP